MHNRPRRWLSGLTSHLPPGQLGRYLLVGIWNTAFGFGLYAGFTALLARYISNSYLPALLLSNLVSITVSFLGYKWFVFKTQGNYLKEWARCVSVYSGSMLFAFVTLPPLVYFFRNVLGYPRQAPYLAGAVITGLSVIISFFGHKHISFRKSRAADPPSVSPRLS
jgi:putative flippase GtrA